MNAGFTLFKLQYVKLIASFWRLFWSHRKSIHFLPRQESHQGLIMIVCLIEFGVREGQLETRNELVAELMKAVVHIDGFVSKETFVSKDQPEKLVTISYWRDSESLDRWMSETVHKRAIGLGRRQVLSYFKTQILTVDRNVEWTAPEARA